MKGGGGGGGGGGEGYRKARFDIRRNHSAVYPRWCSPDCNIMTS